jgi:hypothetical protein
MKLRPGFLSGNAPSTVRRRHSEAETVPFASFVSFMSFMRVFWFFMVATPPSDGMRAR